MPPLPDPPSPFGSSSPGAADYPRTSRPKAPQQQPDLSFLLKDPAHVIALGFGAGLSPVAPGTAGTLWGWASFVVMTRFLGEAAIGWVILGSLLLGWWACAVTARHLRVADPGAIVWDEVVAFWIVLWLVTPAGLLAQASAFILFRIFDAAKPGPVGWADQLTKTLPGRPVRWSYASFGILFDDLVAAFCVLFLFALWKRFVF